MSYQTNAEAFAPGEYIREEIEARGWTQLDLAEILGRPPQAVSEIITGKRSITPDMAKALGDAFGTTAQLWLNLDSSYQLSRVSGKDDSVVRKARLYEIAPLKDMQRRGWIATSTNVDVLESEVLDFYGIKSLSDPIFFHHAARKSTNYSSIWFWHTLMHEMKHVKEREGMEQPTIDMDLVGSDAQPFDDKSESEKSADTFAVEFLINQAKLTAFVTRLGPLFSKARIAAFAATQHVHPGIVVGQLHHKKVLDYRYHRDFLGKVREIITEVSLTDGWGHSIAPLAPHYLTCASSRYVYPCRPSS